MYRRARLAVRSGVIGGHWTDGPARMPERANLNCPASDARVKVIQARTIARKGHAQIPCADHAAALRLLTTPCERCIGHVSSRVPPNLTVRLGRDVNVTDGTGRRRNWKSVLAQAFDVKLDGLADLALRVLRRCAGSDAAGKVGHVSTIVRSGVFDHDRVAI